MSRARTRVWRQGDAERAKTTTISSLATRLQEQGRPGLAVDLLLAAEMCDLLKGRLHRWAETTLEGASGPIVGAVHGESVSDLPREARCSLAIQDVAQQLRSVVTENEL